MTEKKKPGQRGKAKPIIGIEKILVTDREKAAENIIDKLHGEKGWTKKEKKKRKYIKSEDNSRTTITPEVIRDLKVCFSLGLSDEKACYLAKIPQSTYYSYVKKHPELLEEKDYLKDNITDQALLVVGSIISTKTSDFDKKLKIGEYAKWWLNKKHPEFNNRLELSGNLNIENKIKVKIPKNE